MTELTQPDFWEDDYLAGVELPSLPDPAFPFDRELEAALTAHAPVAAGEAVLEIGCAPAKWLGFYARRFGAHVHGIEYTPRGADLSRRNLEALGIDGVIEEADVFTVPPTQADLVLSLGFIEHFEDLAEVYRRHLDFLRPGGLLVIGVPNYRGLMGALQRWADPAHLALHNREAMRPRLYRDLAEQHGLELVHQATIDGPDPIIIKLGRRSATPVVYALGLVRRVPGTQRVNSRWWSTYLLTVMRRPPAG